MTKRLKDNPLHFYDFSAKKSYIKGLPRPGLDDKPTTVQN